MTDSHGVDPATLRALSDGQFAAFVAEFVEATRPEWTAEQSPPSPDRSVDVRLRRGGRRRLLQARRDDRDARIGAPSVRELLALRDARGFDAVTLATTAEFDGAAREAADDRTTLLDGDDLARAAAEADVTVPVPRADGDELDRLLTDLTAYWPDALAERASEAVRAVDERAPFERRVHRADASAELRFRLNGETFVRARFSETSFLLFVDGGDERDSSARGTSPRAGGGPEPVVRLSAFRDSQPPFADLGVEAAVDGALERG